MNLSLFKQTKKLTVILNFLVKMPKSKNAKLTTLFSSRQLSQNMYKLSSSKQTKTQLYSKSALNSKVNTKAAPQQICRAVTLDQNLDNVCRCSLMR